MFKKINEILVGLPMTIVGGFFLVLSLVLPRAGVHLQIDPAWVTVAICGIPLVYLAIWRLIHNTGISKISSALLICIGMFAAIGIGDLFAAGEVAFIIAIGALLEEATVNRAKKGLKKLISLAPTTARRIRSKKEELVPATEIKLDDTLRILPGETVPVDRKILSGETSVDQSILTGESLPVDKGVGDEVFCGTINRFGSIDIRATKIGEDSSLQKLIRMVQDAESKQAPMQRIADRVASWLVPVALLIAAAAYIVTGNVVIAVTVLVVFCPCALVLATPTAIMAAIGQATKHGVIIKSGEALEKMGRVDTIAFDKTGTLTFGQLEVTDVISLVPSLTENTFLTMTASAESRSEHPLGKAITSYAKNLGFKLEEPTDFTMEAGRGVSALVREKTLLCGNEKFLEKHGVSITLQLAEILSKLRAQGKAVVLVAIDGVCAGVIAFADILRPCAKDMVSRLFKTGTHSVLLTGDNHQAANYFAKKVGISEIHANLLPEEKVGNIVKLQEAGKTVCMIGDGVNDAPALKTSNVGVAMGSVGSDIAVEAADIALIGDDISKIPYLKRLSNATVRTIKFSIALSMLINFVAIVLSLEEILTPTTGALVHNAGSCLVVLIAALLYDRKFE